MKRILAIYTSQTDNTKSFLEYLNKRDDVLLFEYDVSELEHMEKGTLASIFNNYDGVMIGAYTWGDGVVPRDMRMFLLKNKDIIPKRKLLLFGSGITVYKFFCGAVDKMEKMIKPRDLEVPKIKFELTFEPEEESESIKIVDKFLKQL